MENTFDTYEEETRDLKAELANACWMISPKETPLMTLIGREPVKSVHPEWQTEEITNPSNQKRVGNYTQISSKKFVDKVDLLRFELRYLKADMEFALLSNKTSERGGPTTPRTLSGLPAWLETNVNRGEGGESGGFNFNTGHAEAAINGKKRPFEEKYLDEVIEKVFLSGGNPEVIICSPYIKTLIGVDYYETKYGTLVVIPSRILGASEELARNVFVIDPDKVCVGIFDDFNINKTEDGDQHVAVEYTLVVNNEAAHGVVADVFGLNANL